MNSNNHTKAKHKYTQYNDHPKEMIDYFDSFSLLFMKTPQNYSSPSTTLRHRKTQSTLNTQIYLSNMNTTKYQFNSCFKLNKPKSKTKVKQRENKCDIMYTQSKRGRAISNDTYTSLHTNNSNHYNNNDLMMNLGHIRRLSDDFNLLRDVYSESHFLGVKFNKTETYIKKKREVYAKYDIEPKLTKDQSVMMSRYIDKNKQNNSKCNVNIINKQYFKDHFQSLKRISINKQLRNQIQLQLSNEQIMRYLHLENTYNTYKYKAALMPKVKVITRSPEEAINSRNNNLILSQNSLINPTQISAMSSIKDKYNQQDSNITNFFSDIKRIAMFNEYNCFRVSYVNHLISKPNSRAAAKMVLCNNYGLKKLFLFGGIDKHRLNDFWECDINNNDNSSSNFNVKAYKWNKKTDMKGDYPSERGGHTISFNKSKRRLYIIGGDFQEIQEDILVYDISLNSFNSINTKTRQEDPVPIRRKNHIAECIGDFIIIFGGKDVMTDSTLNDIWEYNINKEHWLKCNKLNGIQMPKLSSSASTVVASSITLKKHEPAFIKIDKGNFFNSVTKDKRISNDNSNNESIYIFGGYDENGVLTNKTYALIIGKPLECVEIQTKGQCPNPRCDCTINYNEKLNCIVLCGGRSSDSFSRDVFILDIELFNWTKMAISNGKLDRRAQHTSVINENELIIFGGINDTIYLKSDLMILNLNIFSIKRANKDENNQIDVLSNQKAAQRNQCSHDNHTNSNPNPTGYEQRKLMPPNQNKQSDNNFLSKILETPKKPQQINNSNKLILNKNNLFQGNYLESYIDRTKEIKAKVMKIRKEH